MTCSTERERRELLRLRAAVERLAAENAAWQRRSNARGTLALTRCVADAVDHRRPAQPLASAARDVAFPETALEPLSGYLCADAADARLRVGFTLFGMAPHDMEDALSKVGQRQSRDRDFRPVFIVDRPCLVPFHRRGWTVEVVPRALLADHDLVRDRLRFLAAKWGVLKFTALGEERGG